MEDGISVGFGTVGVFNRTLPPKSKVNLDPGYELAIEVMRWFHYRHRARIIVPDGRIISLDHLEEIMLNGYRSLARKWLKYWEFLEPQAREHIREFKEIFKDVLAEMELTRQSY
jgi:hypothetical protein